MPGNGHIVHPLPVPESKDQLTSRVSGLYTFCGLNHSSGKSQVYGKFLTMGCSLTLAKPSKRTLEFPVPQFLISFNPCFIRVTEQHYRPHPRLLFCRCQLARCAPASMDCVWKMPVPRTVSARFNSASFQARPQFDFVLATRGSGSDKYN